MTGKIFKLGVICVLAGIFGAGSAWAVDSPETLRKFEQKRRFARRGVIERWEHYRQYYRDFRNIPLLDAESNPSAVPYYPSVVNDIGTGASLLSVLDADTLDVPGVAIGATSYDTQANYAIGREIATNPGSETVHFVWIHWDRVPDDVEDEDRFVN
ncbi:MAG TPA: hypothetical protein VM118_02495, partial [Acidobacteriota bacterium]|nr:hypothetical protein [Acidobacteriota bacterium]